ncbi:hypothetical protein FIBSPDRAFT_935346 [Athelia psychrophila]|uniref:protein-tyrosine-phosphatase n=1 Tax=Athelia psychrophila TaxID=1759441 RepID=A0A166E075_9AGAM|nr:hypothetical protein FIBSPDRAFT_935346 [Fibularhizoctonia sp. CBS 109695]
MWSTHRFGSDPGIKGPEHKLLCADANVTGTDSGLRPKDMDVGCIETRKDSGANTRRVCMLFIYVCPMHRHTAAPQHVIKSGKSSSSFWSMETPDSGKEGRMRRRDTGLRDSAMGINSGEESPVGTQGLPPGRGVHNSPATSKVQVKSEAKAKGRATAKYGRAPAGSCPASMRRRDTGLRDSAMVSILARKVLWASTSGSWRAHLHIIDVENGPQEKPSEDSRLLTRGVAIHLYLPCISSSPIAACIRISIGNCPTAYQVLIKSGKGELGSSSASEFVARGDSGLQISVRRACSGAYQKAKSKSECNPKPETEPSIVALRPSPCTAITCIQRALDYGSRRRDLRVGIPRITGTIPVDSEIEACAWQCLARGGNTDRVRRQWGLLDQTTKQPPPSSPASPTMDFFSSANPNTNDAQDNLDPFAQAIADRFGSSSIVTARLLPSPSIRDHPPKPPPKLPSPPMASLSLASASPPPASPYTAVAPADLPALLARPGVLVLDIRSHAAYTAARLPDALSLCVPSTLLKRPLFSLEKLAAMLPSRAATAQFATWPAAARILVYDADAAGVPDGSNIRGLLNKFKKEGFAGELAWLAGGFQGVWRTHHHLVRTDPPAPDPEDLEEPALAGKPQPRLLGQLPMAAFSHASTTQAAQSTTRPALALPPMTMTMGMALPRLPARPAANPFFDAIRQNTELSQGITERIPLRLPRRVRRRIGELPFAWLRDIARRAASGGETESGEDEVQLQAPRLADVEEGTEALAMQFYRIELAEQRRLLGVMEYHSKESQAGLAPSRSSPSRPPATATNMNTNATTTEESETIGAGKEPGMGSRREGKGVKDEFPFSITAGVEKGAKNRYRHIWPFEHARVRLHPHPHRRPSHANASPGSSGSESAQDDYVNASYVQPLGTSRRYIATQGPLPATFDDFWTLCWEQNVHVIVMLTREVEGAQVKCGTYWTDTVGPEGETKFARGTLVLKLVSTTTNAPPAPAPVPVPTASASLPLPNAASGSALKPRTLSHSRPRPQMTLPLPASGPAGGFFAPAPAAQKGSTITRTFELRNTRFPGAGARRVTHLQYLDWPDMNVPDDARGVLELVRAVDGAVRRSRLDAEDGKDEEDTEDKMEKEGVDADGDIRMRDQEKEGRGAVDARTGVARHAMGAKSPVLLHCSAGVGRTGGFIAVDALLDAVRRETRKRLPYQERRGKRGDAAAHPGGGNGRRRGGGRGGGAGAVQTVPLLVAAGNQEGAGQTVHVPVVSVPAVAREGQENEEESMSQHEDAHRGKTKHTQNRNRDRASNSNDAGLATDVSNRPRSAYVSGSACTSEGTSGGSLEEESVGAGWTAEGVGERERGGAPSTTRRWAEAVSDSTGVTGGGLKYPNMHGNASATSVAVAVGRRRGALSDSVDNSSESSSSLGMTTSSGMEAGATSSSVGTSMSNPSRSSQVKGKGVDKEDKGKTPMGIVVVKQRSGLRSGSFGSAQGNTHNSSGTSSTAGAQRPPLSTPGATLPKPMSGIASRSTPTLLPSLTAPPLQAQFSLRTERPRHGSETSLENATAGSEQSAPTSARNKLRSPSPQPSQASLPPSSSAHTSSRAPARGFVTAKSHLAETMSSSDVEADTENMSSGSGEDAHMAAIVDYKEPRALHEDFSPPPLSSYEEPVWQVVQDMREQRMSLCQSLRQYVFVHAALIEGALMVLDEEKEAAGVDGGAQSAVRPAEIFVRKASERTAPAADVDSPMEDNPKSTLKPPMHLTMSPTKSKRGASPTELTKKDKKGELSLAKKPSIKRKQTSSPFEHDP